MFFYKQRENSQKMHVFVQRPQKISKKSGKVPSELTRPGATGFEPAQIKRRFAPKSPLVLCGKRTKKTQNIENRYSALVRVTRFEPVACRLRPASRRRIERRFAPKSPLVLCGKRTKKHRVSKTDTLCWSE